MEDIILVGFGGHAKSVVDTIEKESNYRIVGFTDPLLDREYKGYRCLGNDEVLEEYFSKGIRYAFVTLGYMGQGKNRDVLYKKLKEIGYRLPVIIDPSAVLAEDIKIDEGTFVGKNAVINAAAVVGKMCIINTGAVVEHENQIGDFTHVSVNSTLCGNVSVSEHCFIGANATVIQNIKIGSCSIVGAGSIVLRDILPGEKVYGKCVCNSGSRSQS